MEWYFTYHRVSEYAWRHGYIVRRTPAGYYWASALESRRIEGTGTLNLDSIPDQWRTHHRAS